MNFKEVFPIFKQYPNLVFVDNASTTQKPEVVINALTEFYTKYNANVHRGLYPLSEKATQLYEDARIKIAKFINADPEEIIFTSGTTDGVNAIAQSLYSSGIINSRPQILVSEKEHHSNLLPWQQIKDAKLIYLEDITYKNASKIIPPEYNFDVIALAHTSNVTGQINPIKEITNDKRSAFVVVDLAQAIAHTKIDVKDLNVDFAVFSGHKMYGPMGIGVIYAKKEILKNMEPFKVGGGMIREVTRTKSTWADIPSKFEAGTPNVSDAYALGVAVDYINSVGFDFIQAHEQELREYLVNKLKTIDNIKIYHPEISEKSGAVISISFENAHPHDIAQYLGEKDICVRAGHHCTQILHREVLKIPASLRISLAIYNTKEDIDKLIIGIKDALKIYSK